MDELRNHSFTESTSLAISGIWQAVRKERNLKIHLVIALLVILAGFYFRISKAEWLAIILIIFAVLAAEIFNSAVEGVCNLVRDTNHLKYAETKLARDLSAGAVLVLVIGSIILGLLIFLPKLISGII